VRALPAFFEELLQAPDDERETVGTLYLLATHTFALIAQMDRDARKLMGVKRGLFG
jgi:hypothetical protein